MSPFVDQILRWAERNRYTLWSVLILLIMAIFITVAYTVYKSRVTSDKDETDNVANAVRRDTHATLKMFWVDWCPYCKNAYDAKSNAGPWTDFVNKYDGKNVGKSILHCERVDCSPDKDGKAQNEAESTKYKVTSYPTIKLVKEDGTVIDFDSKVSMASLEKFVNAML